jgi:DNA-binding LacI/PurR family transcriptional regulator
MAKDKHKAARLEDIARRAGVSVSTVSRALNGGATVNNETRQRIVDLARSEHYNGPARRPRLARNAHSNAITVVLSPIHSQTTSLIDPFSLSILGGITLALRHHGLDLSISHEVPKDERGLAHFAQNNVQDGIIFLGQSPYHDGLNRLMQGGRKFVVWGHAKLIRLIAQWEATIGREGNARPVTS